METTEFHFNVHMDGKITFEIHYKEGVLPKVFPEARTRVGRAAKATAKASTQESTEVMAVEAIEPEVKEREKKANKPLPARRSPIPRS